MTGTLPIVMDILKKLALAAGWVLCGISALSLLSNWATSETWTAYEWGQTIGTGLVFVIGMALISLGKK